jgi:hypothetical protein
MFSHIIHPSFIQPLLKSTSFVDDLAAHVPTYRIVAAGRNCCTRPPCPTSLHWLMAARSMRWNVSALLIFAFAAAHCVSGELLGASLQCLESADYIINISMSSYVCTASALHPSHHMLVAHYSHQHLYYAPCINNITLNTEQLPTTRVQVQQVEVYLSMQDHFVQHTKLLGKPGHTNH